MELLCREVAPSINFRELLALCEPAHRGRPTISSSTPTAMQSLTSEQSFSTEDGAQTATMRAATSAARSVLDENAAGYLSSKSTVIRHECLIPQGCRNRLHPIATCRASAAIPGLFPAVTMRGQIFLDGGVAANTPIRPAVKAGATELHVISLNPEVPGEYTGATGDIFNRVFMAMVAANISEDIKSAEWVNKGIEIIERIDANESDKDASEQIDGADCQRFVRAAGIIQQALKANGVLPRRLTIHRYFPRTALGGAADMLNFDRSAIDRLIQRGYEDACAHKCKDGDRDICLIPKTVANGRSAAGMS